MTPKEEREARPWERKGQVRRDAEPHRWPRRGSYVEPRAERGRGGREIRAWFILASPETHG